MTEPTRWHPRLWRRRLAGAALLLAAVALADWPVATERITTPHWTWPTLTPPVRVVFLVNAAASRQPYELAARFPLAPQVVPVHGDAYTNTFDEVALAQALAAPPAVVVVAAANPWRDLAPAAVDGLRAAVAGGWALLVVQRHAPGLAPVPFEGLKLVLDRDAPLPAEATRQALFGQPGQPQVYRAPHGRGTVTVVTGFDLHGTFHTAFLPRNQPYAELPVAPELAYALVGRLLLRVAGWQPSAGTPHQRWYSRFGEPLGDGAAPPRPGTVVRQWWQATAAGALADCGADVVTTPQATALQDVRTDGADTCRWQLAGQPQAADHVIVQATDADGRLLAVADVPAAAGSATWHAASLTTRTLLLRLLLVRGDQVLDEQRRCTTIAGPFAPMPVIVWGSQTGSPGEQWEYLRLRQLGINAITANGRQPRVAEMAAAAGLRLVPTNVYVPPKKAGTDADALREQLAAYAAAVAGWQPLGYSLADEPGGTDQLDWLRDGRAVICRHDPAARVGYCGVWLKPPLDVPAMLAACDLFEGYSPLHLYTPNLWLGSERDLLRAFRRPDALVTCWTHYVNPRDHEPYARTVPWLWLFEGMDGISYFCSLLEFGVLHNDLTAAPDSRWWAEEVATLQAGIAAQLRRLARDDGTVRVLYHPASDSANGWALALNRANIPYRWLSRAQLAAGLGADLRLLVISDGWALDEAEVAALERWVKGGGRLLAVGGLGVTAPPALRARLADLQGLAPRPTLDWTAQRETFASVPATTTLGGLTIAGTTSGEVGWTPAGAAVVGRYTRLGIATAPPAETVPAFVRDLFAAPAVLRHPVGPGEVWSLAVQPDLDSKAALLAHCGATPTPARVLAADDTPAPAVYLYPLRDGPLHAWGIIQDYWRVPAAEQLAAPTPATQAAVAHGRARWATQPARLVLPTAGHLYDVRRGAYVGEGTTAVFALTPGRPELFAQLPYRVTGLTITAPPTAAAGRPLPLRFALATTAAAPGTHVVHVAAPALTEPVNLPLPGGTGELALPLPLNALGRQTITAREPLSGMTATCVVEITGEPPAVALLAPPAVVVEDLAPALPAGAWQPRTDDAARPGVEATVRPLSQTPLFIGDHAGQWHLRGGFVLRNAATTWQAVYQVCNDWKANQWPDPRMVAAPYLPGLGFRQPAAHTWYYNGYLQVFLDQFNATRYALTAIRREDDPPNGRITCTWDTPVGELRLTAVLTPDSPALFQELRLRPTHAAKRLELRFRSYPNGFGGGKAWIHEEPVRRSWAILGDQLRDRAYGQGMGPGAILIVPAEWEQWTFGQQTVLTRTLDARAPPLGPALENAPPEQEADPLLQEISGQKAAAAPPPALPELRVHWCLWSMPESGNDAFLTYLKAEAAGAGQRLAQLFPPTAAAP